MTCTENHRALFDDNNFDFGDETNPKYMFSLKGYVDYDTCKPYNGIHYLYNKKDRIGYIEERTCDNEKISIFKFDQDRFNYSNPRRIDSIYFRKTGRHTLFLDDYEGNYVRSIEEVYGKSIKHKNFEYIINDGFSTFTKFKNDETVSYLFKTKEREILLSFEDEHIEFVEDKTKIYKDDNSCVEHITKFIMSPLGYATEKIVTHNGNETFRCEYEQPQGKDYKRYSLFPNDLYKDGKFNPPFGKYVKYGSEVRNFEQQELDVDILELLEVAELKRFIIHAVNSNNSHTWLKNLKDQM